MSPRKKHIAIAVGLIVLIGAVGVGVFWPSGFLRGATQNGPTPTSDSRRTNATTPTASGVNSPPITGHLRLMLGMKSPPRAEKTENTNDDGKSCGLESIKSALDGDENQAFALATKVNEAIRRVAERMLSSGTEQERAQALSLLASLAGDAAYNERPGVRHRCGDNDECNARLAAERMRAITPHITALAQLAANTRDPTVYATAFHQCRSEAVSACNALSAERWTELDPSNAVPLLLIASGALARNDLAGRDRALLAASNAVLYDPRAISTLRIAQSDAILAEAPSVASLASVTLLAMDSLFLAPDYSMILRYCAPPGDTPSGRRGICTRLAEKMVEQDQLLLGRRVAERLARYAGWPADRLATLADENDAMYQIMQTATFDIEHLSSCEGSKRLQTWFSDVSRIGEVAALRQRVAASSKSVAELAEERRAADRKLRKELNEKPAK